MPVEEAEEQMVSCGCSGRPNPIVRFLKWWASLFVLLGPLAVCPFCGQAGCGGGALSAGVLGAVVAALTFVPRRIVRLFHRHEQPEEPVS